jgi:CheY-like chemotaxis protein
LIVDNDPNDGFFINRALRSSPGCGFTLVCRNLAEARAYLVGEGSYADRGQYPMPDLVISDLNLISHSAADLIRWVRQQPPPLQKIPIVILTGSAAPADLAAVKLAGAQNIFEKPCTFEALVTLVAEITRDC